MSGQLGGRKTGTRVQPASQEPQQHTESHFIAAENTESHETPGENFKIVEREAGQSFFELYISFELRPVQHTTRPVLIAEVRSEISNPISICPLINKNIYLYICS